MEKEAEFKVESELFLRVAEQLRELYKKLAYDNMHILNAQVNYLNNEVKEQKGKVSSLTQRISLHEQNRWFRCFTCNDLHPYRSIKKPNTKNSRRKQLCNECYASEANYYNESGD